MAPDLLHGLLRAAWVWDGHVPSADVIASWTKEQRDKVAEFAALSIAGRYSDDVTRIGMPMFLVDWHREAAESAAREWCIAWTRRQRNDVTARDQRDHGGEIVFFDWTCHALITKGPTWLAVQMDLMARDIERARRDNVKTQGG